MLTFTFSKISGYMTGEERLTSGMVGKQVRFVFSPEWESLNKTAVFTDGYVTRVVPNVGEETVIPSDVLKIPGRRLVVGIYGKTADGNVVIPTLRVEGPMVEQGIDPFARSVTDRSGKLRALTENMDPEQLLVMIGDISALDTESKFSLVEAVNELAARPVADVPPEEVEEILREYLQTHPDIKNAYQYALDGGYAGTEEEFSRKLAEEVPNPYQYAQAVGYAGTEEEFIRKLLKDIPDPYTLPVASSRTLGGVKPVPATEDMTRSVGVDENGRLWTYEEECGYGAVLTGYAGNTEAELEEALLGVINTMANYSTKQIRCSMAFLGKSGFYLTTVFRHTSTYVLVTFQSMSFGGAVLQKVYSGGTWSPIEWRNPPMELGVEYRTTERYQEKSVYIKAVDLGTLPASGDKGVAYTSTPSKKVVSMEAYAITASGNVNQFPFYSTAGVVMGKVSAATTKIFVDALSDMSNCTGFAVIKYLKD